MIYAAPVFYLQAAISERMAAWPSGEDRLPLPFHPLDDFSDVPAVRSMIANDSLRWQHVPRRFVAAVGEARRRAMAEVPAIRVPTMTLLAARDSIVDNDPTRALLAAAGAVHTIEACHAMVLEEPEAIAARVASFLTDVPDTSRR
jgi:pimeloyl-ACP methyl ester carboxylesterase